MRRSLLILALIVPSLVSGLAHAQVTGQAPQLNRVRVDEKLGRPLPLGAAFRDHRGRPVRLAQFFDGKRPVMLVFAYHTCPVLCSMVLDATVKGLRGVEWTAGNEFDVVTISIDPNDQPARAAAKRTQVMQRYSRSSSGRGWHFLVGDDENIRKVTDAVGYRYFYDEPHKQYAHPAVVTLITPNGRIARYLYGIQYDPQDLRFGLLEASEGRSVSTVEKVLMYCYQYDPEGGKYALVAMRVMQVGGGATALLIGAALFVLWRREWRRSRAKTDEASTFPMPPSRQV